MDPTSVTALADRVQEQHAGRASVTSYTDVSGVLDLASAAGNLAVGTVDGTAAAMATEGTGLAAEGAGFVVEVICAVIGGIFSV